MKGNIRTGKIIPVIIICKPLNGGLTKFGATPGGGGIAPTIVEFIVRNV
jgi:hypothetical protein